MNLNVLPEKIYMDNLITVLDLYGKPIPRTLNLILSSAQSYSLPIYFDEGINGSKMNDSYEDHYDSHGVVIKIMACGEVSYIRDCKSVIAANAWMDDTESNTFISVFSFISKGESYYSVDETNMYVQSTSFHYKQFYCIRDELNKYLNELDDCNKDKPIALRKTGNGIQKRRLEAFKVWLATSAEIKIINDDSYQYCYEKIREPTKKEVWEKLQKVDSRLFSAGYDEFHKEDKIIKFKQGTGKGREN